MTIICSWCRGEGDPGYVGEKAPLEDRRETHGICTSHRMVVQMRWQQLYVKSDLKDVLPGTAATSWSANQIAHLWAGLRKFTRKPRR
jgi:hypothetical protein